MFKRDNSRLRQAKTVEAVPNTYQEWCLQNGFSNNLIKTQQQKRIELKFAKQQSERQKL